MALNAVTLAMVTGATGCQLEAWAKDVVGLDKRMKNATDEFRGSLFDAGMVVYGVKTHHQALINQKHVGSNAPWSATWKRMTGTEKPSPRATTMAIAVEAYLVESGHLTEAELRACPVDSAEVAVGIYRDVGETFTDPAVLKARDLLKGYTAAIDDKARKAIIKQLRDLRRSLKEVEPMEADEAKEMLKRILTANPQFAVLVATDLVAHLRYEKDTEVLHGVWSQFQLANDVWPADEVDAWLNPGGTTPASAPTRSEPVSQPAAPEAPATPTPDFAGWVNTALPGIAADKARTLSLLVEKFHAFNGVLPADVTALSEWAKARAAANAAPTPA